MNSDAASDVMVNLRKTNRVIFTGGPGTGKTTTLKILQSLGYRCAVDSARDIIAQRKRAGLSPRPAPMVFANEILLKDIAAYNDIESGKWIFFDRSIFDALCMIDGMAPLSVSALRNYTTRYLFNAQVFLFPPWRNIYRQDDERDQTYAESEKGFTWVKQWYTKVGFCIIEVPRSSPTQRANFILRQLGDTNLEGA